MATAQQLLDEYIQLRTNGLDAQTVLQLLRGRIELLPANERASVVRQVKEWETRQVSSNASGTPGKIKPITARVRNGSGGAQAPVQHIPAFVQSPYTETQTAPAGGVVACPNCGKTNDAPAVLCFSCGFVLQTQQNPFSTVPLANLDNPKDGSYFGSESTLVLTLRGTKKGYFIQPQKQDHEVIIGRSDGSAMQPDIDLADQGAGQLGVSRLHVGIQYNGKHNTISASDMNSANGTFVNGQRLHPQEIRVLRHGDELRIGRMVFQVFFQQNP